MGKLMDRAIFLPDAAWRHQSGLNAVVQALGGDQGLVRLVGGCVRDALMNMAAHDIDLATTLDPQNVMQRLSAADIKVVPTGIAHGTVTAVTPEGSVEVTTLRRDVSTDGRRATIAYTDDWQEDAARRDFTINALYADPISGAVTDYFDGLADLREGIVKFIGDPVQRIAEDHLRILRFFRFHARFGQGDADPAGLAACAARANDLMALSRERIADEVFKILALPNPASIVALMIATGVFVPVLPEVNDVTQLLHLINREAVFALPGDPLRRLASLVPAQPQLAESIAVRLKLSNAQRKRMVSAAGRSPEDAANPRAMAYWISQEFAIDRLLLGDGALSEIVHWTPPHFPLTGGAIVARGVVAGPDVARLLKCVEQQWVKEDFPDRTRLESIADALCASASSQIPHAKPTL
jgi:poly(A) polymerase